MSDLKRIKDWADDEKPREKLGKQGRSALSNSELIAILISTGTPKKSALDIARELLNKSGNDLFNLAKWEISDFCKIDGIGAAKAVTIMAALELSARRMNSTGKEINPIKGSFDAYERMRYRLENLGHEEFWMMTLNRSNCVINAYKISEGGITSTVVDQRRIFKMAIEDKSTGIILFHNHPSGNKKPSDSDNALTRKIKEGGKLLDINVLDHIIIAQAGYYSYADEGLL